MWLQGHAARLPACLNDCLSDCCFRQRPTAARGPKQAALSLATTTLVIDNSYIQAITLAYLRLICAIAASDALPADRHATPQTATQREPEW